MGDKTKHVDEQAVDVLETYQNDDGTVTLKTKSKKEHVPGIVIKTVTMQNDGSLIYKKSAHVDDSLYNCTDEEKIKSAEELCMDAKGKIGYLYYRRGANLEDVEYGTGNTPKPGQYALMFCRNNSDYLAIETYRGIFSSDGKLLHVDEVVEKGGAAHYLAVHDKDFLQEMKQLRIEAIHKAAKIHKEQTNFWHNCQQPLMHVPMGPLGCTDLPHLKADGKVLAV